MRVGGVVLTLRFSGGVKRRPLEPVVMSRIHATSQSGEDQNRQGLPCAPALQYVVSAFTPS